VEDVRFFDGTSDEGTSHLLSESFAGCSGGRWTGFTEVTK
jgi:hypothetical protein